MAFDLNSPEWAQISATADAVCGKADKLGLLALSPDEQAFLCVWVADGHICGGSFLRFFHYHADLLACAANAYQAVGLPGLAKIVRRAVAEFPHPSESEDDRLQQLDSLDEKTSTALDDLFGEYCDTKNSTDSVDEALHQFARLHLNPNSSTPD